MKILGIGDHISCGSALLEDGVVVSAITDERLIREKMAFGVPRSSIARILKENCLSPGHIDLITVATRNQHLIDGYVDFRNGWFGLERGKAKQLIFDVASRVSRFKSKWPFLPHLYYLVRQPFYRHRRQALERILRREFGLQAPLQFVDHHYCHALTAYYGSGFEDALVVSIDGGGDALSSQVYDVEQGRFRLLNQVSSYDSMGVFYSYITEICGFKAGRHEGKITGLAAHGCPLYVDLLEELMTCRDGTFHNRGNVFFWSALEKIRSLLPRHWKREDLAASIQAFTEKMVVRYVSHWQQKTKRQNIALAGGLFANVAVNRRIHELPDTRQCYIFPAMSDEGMPVGAALSGYYDRTHPVAVQPKVCSHHVYLGPSFSEEEIEEELRRAGIEASRPQDLEKGIAELLAEGNVVARFDGRMEFGPRALGNRSILYQATDPSVNDWLNQALKRTEFMPFAPATLEEEAERCFQNLEGARNTARFMTITFLCTPWMRKVCPGVVHLDGTARPQLVNRKDNPSFYRIIQEYFRLTGIPSIINTSFNMHEEPIVCTPADAIRAFQQGQLDYLVIGGFLAANPTSIRGRKVESSQARPALYP